MDLRFSCHTDLIWPTGRACIMVTPVCKCAFTSILLWYSYWVFGPSTRQSEAILLLAGLSGNSQLDIVTCTGMFPQPLGALMCLPSQLFSAVDTAHTIYCPLVLLHNHVSVPIFWPLIYFIGENRGKSPCATLLLAIYQLFSPVIKAPNKAGATYWRIE